MRKMMIWYLILIMLTGVCILGVWYYIGTGEQPTDAVLAQAGYAEQFRDSENENAQCDNSVLYTDLNDRWREGNAGYEC